MELLRIFCGDTTRYGASHGSFGSRAWVRRTALMSVAVGALLSRALGVDAQPPDQDLAWLPESGDEEDAAVRGLRSLYVPEGLTAESAVEQALRTSPDLRRTRSLALEAQGGAQQAMSALVPRLEMSGRASRLNELDTPSLQPSGPQTPELVGMVEDPAAQELWQGLTSFQFPALANQYSLEANLIYSFTRSLAEALPTYRAAQKNEEAAAQQFSATVNDVALDARRAYYEFARAKAGLEVATSAVDAAAAQRDETAAQVRAGSAARVDLLRVEAQFEATKVALARAKLGFEVSQRALQTLMHTEDTPTLGEDLSESVGGVPRGSERDLKERADRNRPDLQALKTYIESTQHELRAAKGSAAPDLFVSAGAEYSNPNFRIVPQEQRFVTTWQVTAGIRWAPNDTVEGVGRVKQLRAALEQAYADAERLADAIRVEVAAGYQGVLAARSAWKSAVLGLSAAEESYRVKREQLRTGLVNTTELLQAQTDLIRAQVDVVDSVVDLRIARAELRRAVGLQP